MGFDGRCINWIMLCMNIVQYLVLVNNHIVSPIKLGCGLQQGCPYRRIYLLFVLKACLCCLMMLNGGVSCMEVVGPQALTTMLKQLLVVRVQFLFLNMVAFPSLSCWLTSKFLTLQDHGVTSSWLVHTITYHTAKVCPNQRVLLTPNNHPQQQPRDSNSRLCSNTNYWTSNAYHCTKSYSW